MPSDCPIPSEQPAAIVTDRRKFSIGLPESVSGGESRFPLTPEAVQELVERGFAVRMERGAARSIHYPDGRYESCGAEIVERPEALGCDIVIHLAPLSPADVELLRRGAMLLTFLRGKKYTPATVKALLQRSVISVALDCVKDKSGRQPFADIMAEVDGRAAVSVASAMLADAATGKGILLGGITGIVPCEVTIFGSGLAAIAAARSAIGLGAQVRLFDDDVYSLREALRLLGLSAVGSALHSHVVEGALRSADIVIATAMGRSYPISRELVGTMKRGVLVFDLSDNPGDAFPSLPVADLSFGAKQLDGRRHCYINAGCTVPRTSAMALSDTLMAMLGEILTNDGVTNALKLSQGLQAGVLTFLGRPVNAGLARLVSMRPLDLALFIQMS